MFSRKFEILLYNSINHDHFPIPSQHLIITRLKSMSAIVHIYRSAHLYSICSFIPQTMLKRWQFLGLHHMVVFISAYKMYQTQCSPLVVLVDTFISVLGAAILTAIMNCPSLSSGRASQPNAPDSEFSRWDSKRLDSFPWQWQVNLVSKSKDIKSPDQCLTFSVLGPGEGQSLADQRRDSGRPWWQLSSSVTTLKRIMVLYIVQSVLGPFTHHSVSLESPSWWDSI